MSTPLPQTLAGKVALVTGSSRGIGKAILLRLAAHGANVVVNYVSSSSAAESVAKEARRMGVEAICVQADVSKQQDLANLFQKTKQEFGRLDIVMSNSGIEHFGKLEEVTEDEIDKVFGVNVKGQFMVAQQASKYLEDGGRLFLISSISAVMGIRDHALYAASKAAVQGMVKCLAWDFGSRQITVNAIAPGGVKTDMYAEVAAKYIPGGDKLTVDEIDAKLGQWSPLGRPGFPEDVAGIIAMLSGPEAQWITGQTIHASGGAHMV
ncbi:NAD(P)-binding protein [Saccharata proteae CBS 121410]|uniref:NAD(P)-binding protein n=1 Tax=Saccharata proteae CBS 121410 TaxID=1314787 RepID=A0A9P4HVW5_9PEZI|nr:NAD(P)-binding protein [Saccharata proteae CBS 121410]